MTETQNNNFQDLERRLNRKIAYTNLFWAAVAAAGMFLAHECYQSIDESITIVSQRSANGFEYLQQNYVNKDQLNAYEAINPKDNKKLACYCMPKAE